MLKRLKELAQAATEYTAQLSVGGQQCPWFDATAMAAKLGMDADDPDAAYIAEASPDRILKVVAALEAAKKALDHMATVQEIARQWEPDNSSGQDRRWLVLARDDERALRAALASIEQEEQKQ